MDAERETARGEDRPVVRLLCRDERLARGLSLFLADIGLETAPAGDGRTPALILLDADVPLAQELPAGVPTIAFTCGKAETDADGRRFSALLHRPVSLDGLEATVRGILGTLPAAPAGHGAVPGERFRAPEPTAASVTAVPDGTGGWLRAGGQSVRLTPTEWALYLCLRGADGAPVSRGTLSACAGDGKNPADRLPARTVDVYICYLRRKLAALPGSGQVVTVRGQGYRLTP